MEKTYKILVVDDEDDLREILRFNLEMEGYAVDTAPSAEEALEMGIAGYDLLLLDVMMGGMSGFALAKKMQQDDTLKRVPIVFLTARDAELDTVTGFNLGADDYIAKPFSIREVLLRIKAVLRRTSIADKRREEGRLAYEGLVIDENKKTVTVDGKDVSFTKTEFEILRLLMSHSGKVFSRGDLIAKVWPGDVYVLDRTVDVNITRLRKKIGSYASLIVTRLGFGYIFDA